MKYSPSNEFVTITVSLIGVISSIIALVFSYFNSRKLEKYRSLVNVQAMSSMEFLKQYLNFKNEGKEKELKAFQQLLAQIQIIRDKIRIVTKRPNSFGKVTLEKEVDILKKDLEIMYANNQLNFNEENRQFAHILKNDCCTILLKLPEILTMSGKKFESYRDSILKEELMIAEKQDHLRKLSQNAIELFMAELKENVIRDKNYG